MVSRCRQDVRLASSKPPRVRDRFDDETGIERPFSAVSSNPALTLAAERSAGFRATKVVDRDRAELRFAWELFGAALRFDLEEIVAKPLLAPNSYC
jgi:hypothetical protein